LVKKIYCVVGRTGSGKDTLVSAVAKIHNMNVLRSYTTRPRRFMEGDNHIFISEKEFEQYKDDIIAYTEINGFRYFCTKSQLEDTDFYIIDPNGIDYLRKALPPSEYDLIIIYIDLDYESRKKRATKQRRDEVEVFESRNFSEDHQFTRFEERGEWDYYIFNDDLKPSIEEFEHILSIEKD
jgi:guanylate kinase